MFYLFFLIDNFMKLLISYRSDGQRKIRTANVTLRSFHTDSLNLLLSVLVDVVNTAKNTLDVATSRSYLFRENYLHLFRNRPVGLLRVTVFATNQQ